MAAQEALIAPGGLRPVLANLLQLLRRPSLPPLIFCLRPTLSLIISHLTITSKISSGPGKHRPLSWVLLALCLGLQGVLYPCVLQEWGWHLICPHV